MPKFTGLRRPPPLIKLVKLSNQNQEIISNSAFEPNDTENSGTVVRVGKQMKVKKGKIKNIALVFPFVLLCLMPANLYSFWSIYGDIRELFVPSHNFGPKMSNGTDKRLINSLYFLKGTDLYKITDNFYTGRGARVIDFFSLFDDGSLLSSNVNNTITYRNIDILACFFTMLYKITDNVYVQLDIDLFDPLPLKNFQFNGNNVMEVNEFSFHSVKNYFAYTFGNVGSPTLSLGVRFYKDLQVKIFFKYNHNAILNNFIQNTFYNKVLEAHNTLRAEYKPLVPVDEIKYLFNNIDVSYVAVGISIGWGGK